MNIILCGGNGMRVNDGDAYWGIGDRLAKLGHQVRRREAMETLGATQVMTPADVAWAGACIVYSYGMATLWDRQRILIEMGTPATFTVLAAIAPVNDIWLAQSTSVWHPPAHITHAACWQPTQAVPESQPFRDTELWVLFGDEIPDAPRININCDAVVDGFGPVSQHTHIKDDPELIEAVAGWTHSHSGMANDSSK